MWQSCRKRFNEICFWTLYDLKICEEYSYTLVHVPYQFKTSQIFKIIKKTVLEFYGMLEFIPNQYKPEMICGKVVNDYPYAVVNDYSYAQDSLPDCYMIQELCEKAVDARLFVLDSVPDCFKTQEMWEKIVFKESCMLKYCLDTCKNQNICEKNVYVCLHLDWFVRLKMLEEGDNAAIFDAVMLNDDFDNKIDEHLGAEIDDDGLVRFNIWHNRFRFNIWLNRYK